MTRPTEAIKRHQRRQKLLANLRREHPDGPQILKAEALFVSADDIEDSGYAVVSQHYLARLEFIASQTFAFLDDRIDQETLLEELTYQR